MRVAQLHNGRRAQQVGDPYKVEDLSLIHILTETLKYAQRSFTVKSCKGDLEIGSGKQYNGAIGGNVYCHYPDGVIRKMNNEDTLNQFKLEDTSDMLDFGTINYFQDYSKGFTLDQKIFSNIASVSYTHLGGKNEKI